MLNIMLKEFFQVEEKQNNIMWEPESSERKEKHWK